MWAFVDYENIGSLEHLPIERYQRIFVFCGPRDRHIRFGSLPTNSFCPIEVIGIEKVATNNLDFHLAFHLGRYHEIAPQGLTFHIVSNDKGFTGLVDHLNSLGRDARWVRVFPGSIVAKVSSGDSPGVARVRTLLGSIDQQKRPRKKAGLVNWIAANTRSLDPPMKPGKIYRVLVEEKWIEEDDDEKIVYLLPS